MGLNTKKNERMHISRKLACANWCVNGYAAMFLGAISLI